MKTLAPGKSVRQSPAWEWFWKPDCGQGSVLGSGVIAQVLTHVLWISYPSFGEWDVIVIVLYVGMWPGHESDFESQIVIRAQCSGRGSSPKCKCMCCELPTYHLGNGMFLNSIELLCEAFILWWLKLFNSCALIIFTCSRVQTCTLLGQMIALHSATWK